MLFQETYQNKKVFITGHTGFKGSWLLAWLHLLGAEMKCYSLPPAPEHKLYNQINGDDLCNSTFNDILDYPSLEQSILDFQPDFIFHLAAQAIVRTSYEEPLETFSINAIGTANVLNVVRKLSKRCVVILVTTDKVYNNREWPYPYRETDRLGGYDPYSASKACAELIIDSYRNSFFNCKQFQQHQKSVAVARAGNVIGGGDWAKNRIVPDLIRALQDDEPLVIRNPTSVRPWQHVLEPLCAYLLLGKKMAENPLSYSTEFNFGPLVNDCWPVEKMVQYAISIFGKGTYQLSRESDGLHEAGLLKLDISKAEQQLKWKPVYRAAEAIEKTIDWYKKFNGQNAYHLIINDIKAFSAIYSLQ
jgi:CDP-glucose 4,6-dehydratase